MKRIQSTDAVAVLPAASESGTTGYFTNGDPGGGIPATTVQAEWLNRVQEELVGVIEGAGDTLDGADNGQLLAAIQALIADAAVQRPGSVVQAAYSEDNTQTACASFTGATPEITSGGFVVEAEITPTDAGNDLLITAVFPFTTSSGSHSRTARCAIFKVGTTAALAEDLHYEQDLNESVTSKGTMTIRKKVAAGSTSAQTFQLRAADCTSCGFATAAYASIKVEEIKV